MPVGGLLRNLKRGAAALTVTVVLGTALGLWLFPRPSPQSTALKPGIGERVTASGSARPAERAGLGSQERAGTLQGPADPLEVERQAPEAYDLPTGEALYGAACASCHMTDGLGARGTGAGYPALAGNPKVQSPEFVVAVILGGAGAMPSFAGHLTDEQVALVVNHVRQTLNTYPDPLNAPAVRPLRQPTSTPGIDGDAG